MEINITLIAVIVLAVFLMYRGYKKGFAKEISGTVALAVACFSLMLLLMLYSSYQAGEAVNVIYSVVFLVVLGAVYGVAKLLLKSIKAISNLPIFNILDKLLGIVIGAVKAVLIVWLVLMFCVENNVGQLTEYVCADLEKSVILKTIYQYNFFIR